MNYNFKEKVLSATPVTGCIVFFLLYTLAAIYYPGGSQADSNSIGFSLIHNYWCNLLNEKALNGQYNPGRSFAISGMFVLCYSLSVFWYLVSNKLKDSVIVKRIILFCGISSMIISLFLFTSFHDTIINLAGFSGFIALVLTYRSLFSNRYYGLFAFGIINLFLIVINSFIYYSGYQLFYLPVIQKISFVSFLAWICLVTIYLNKSISHPARLDI